MTNVWYARDGSNRAVCERRPTRVESATITCPGFQVEEAGLVPNCTGFGAGFRLEVAAPGGTNG